MQTPNKGKLIPKFHWQDRAVITVKISMTPPFFMGVQKDLHKLLVRSQLRDSKLSMTARRQPSKEAEMKLKSLYVKPKVDLSSRTNTLSNFLCATSDTEYHPLCIPMPHLLSSSPPNVSNLTIHFRLGSCYPC